MVIGRSVRRSWRPIRPFVVPPEGDVTRAPALYAIVPAGHSSDALAMKRAVVTYVWSASVKWSSD